MKKIKLTKSTRSFLEATSDYVLGKYMMPDFIIYRSPEGEYYLLDENDAQDDLNDYLDSRLHSLLAENGVFVIPTDGEAPNFGINTGTIGEA